MTDPAPQNQSAKISWKPGGLPVCTRFDDPYFSIDNGLAETRHVFLSGNDLPARFAAGFHIAETGFGTGLNMFAALLAWRNSGQTTPLHFTSFEAYPMTAPEMDRALAAFPEARAISGPFLDLWDTGKRHIKTGDLNARIITGDARQTLPTWGGRADAWFLDGFSPAKNPELWEPALMQQIATHTAPGGTCATYTAAGFVRRNLADAGFTVTRVPGFGRKRHMTTGTLS
jgi:tRNA U34 5-methylaminomethyl-2-thiouridine-forming methyltransferase MnmC